jgi:DNA-binding response OmpR family regulator
MIQGGIFPPALNTQGVVVMTGFFGRFFTKPTLASLNTVLTRDRLIQSGRIIFIDDESPLLMDELKQSGFAVDHDKTGGDLLHNYDNQTYDVAIVDYHGVGRRLGSGQGFEVTKYLRRVSPRTRLIAYTSRSLSAAESDFFRQSDVVLPKDFGLGDSMSLIETELRKALSKEHLFQALVSQLNLSSGEERLRMQEALINALSKRKESQFKAFLKKTAGDAAMKGVEIILSKLFID